MSELFPLVGRLARRVISLPWRDETQRALRRPQLMEDDPAAMVSSAYLQGRDSAIQFAGYLLVQSKVPSLRETVPVSHLPFFRPMSDSAMEVYSRGHLLLSHIEGRLLAAVGGEESVFSACAAYTDIDPSWVIRNRAISEAVAAGIKSVEASLLPLEEEFGRHPAAASARKTVEVLRERGVSVNLAALRQEVAIRGQQILLGNAHQLRRALTGDVPGSNQVVKLQMRLIGDLLYLRDSLSALLQVVFHAFRDQRLPTLNEENVFQVCATRGGDYLETEFRVQPVGDELFCVPGDLMFVDVDEGSGRSWKGPMRLHGKSMQFGGQGTECRFALHELDVWLCRHRFLYAQHARAVAGE